MQQQFIEREAFELGAQAADHAINEGDGILTHERARRSLVNKAEAIEDRARLKILNDERDSLRTLLHNILRPDLNGPQRGRYFLGVAAVLALTGLFLAHLSFSPFGFGWYAWVFSIGLPFVCAFLTDLFLERCGSVAVVRTLVTTALIASLTGLVILAVIRGDILVLFVRNSLGGSEAVAGQTGEGEAAHFYQNAARELQVFFGLMAFGIEVATGLAVWEARRVLSSIESLSRQRLLAVESEMVQFVGRIAFLDSESDIFAHEFQRDYCRGLIHAAQRRSLERLGHFLVIACMSGLLLGRASAQPHVVEAIDLSQSSDGQEYERNVRAASQLVFKLPPGSRLDVVGITDKSFSKPVFIFTGTLPVDPGPLQFLDQIMAARERFAREIDKAGQALKPTAATTDIFGALAVAEDLFQQSKSSQRSIVLLSDMRQSAKLLNIELGDSFSIDKALRIAESNHLNTALTGVNVYVLGAHAEGKGIEYWRTLHQFWMAYFSKAGATLRTFSLTRDLPDMVKASAGNRK